jgi:hypothetical protein
MAATQKYVAIPQKQRTVNVVSQLLEVDCAIKALPVKYENEFRTVVRFPPLRPVAVQPITKNRSAKAYRDCEALAWSHDRG